MASKAAAQAKKTEGNNLFKAKKYAEAIEKYTEAIANDASDVTFYSNRSACHAALEQWEQAADDGRTCIMTDKNFVKGYFRAGLAMQNLGNLDAALDYVKRGLGIESGNADLKRMSRELEDAMRKKKVESYCSQAEGHIASRDVYKAYATLDAALRLEPTDAKLNRLMDQVRPQYEAAEKTRVSSLSGPDRLKEQGDALYKAASFEDAIKMYTRCLESISDKQSALALKCYGNRAACFKQISNFDGTIGDSTAVLEVNPDDVKSLMRRAQAYEACERYKSALQDVRQVLSYGPTTVGQSTYDLANGMQHRLNRVIQQLKNA